MVGTMEATAVEDSISSVLSCTHADQTAPPTQIPEDMVPTYNISDEEARGIMEVIAVTGKFWHDWNMLKSLLSSRLKQVLEEYPEAQMVGGGGTPQNTLSEETYPEFVNRLDEALLSFTDGPPFTLQRICEILLSPKTTYRTLPKLALALEKNLLVTSALTICTEPYPIGLLQGPIECENGSGEPEGHSSPVPNGIETPSGDADEEMIEAEADEDAMNTDMDVQEENDKGGTSLVIGSNNAGEPPANIDKHD